jgi:hypothetical protein
LQDESVAAKQQAPRFSCVASIEKSRNTKRKGFSTYIEESRNTNEEFRITKGTGFSPYIR